MDIKTRQKLITELLKEVLSVTDAKGQAYASNKDSLSNFKEVASRTGLTKYQVWEVYFQKHIISVENAIKQDPNKPVEKTESLHGRLIDIIAYCGILEAMTIEDLIPIEPTQENKEEKRDNT